MMRRFTVCGMLFVFSALMLLLGLGALSVRAQDTEPISEPFADVVLETRPDGCDPCDQWIAVELKSCLRAGLTVHISPTEDGVTPRFRIRTVERPDLWQVRTGYRSAGEIIALVRGKVGVSATPRSPEWPRVRREYMKAHPTCEACGGKIELNVHHIVPFHTPDGKRLELESSNLITLCRRHHFEIGHDPDGPDGPELPNWSAENPNARADAALMLQTIKAR